MPLEAVSPFLDFAAIPPPWRVAGGAILGAILGSFIAALVARWPRGESVAKGRSRCDSCGKPLAARDLVPLISFPLNRGRCRYCGAKIGAFHWVSEILGALIGGVSLYVYPSEIGLAGAAFGWMLLALALLDMRHFWLPDRIVLPLILMGLACSFLAGPPSPLESALGAAIGYLGLQSIRISYRLLRGREGLGGGDPKLFAAIGAWLGGLVLPFVLLAASVLGIMAAITLRMAGKPLRRDSELAFGAMLAAAAWPLWLALPAFYAALGR